MRFTQALSFVLAVAATGVSADPLFGWPWGDDPKPAKCAKYAKPDSRWSMRLFKKDNCGDKFRSISYREDWTRGANQCFYFTERDEPGSFDGIASGSYSISWYVGNKCKGEAVATTIDGKYVKMSKWKGPLSFMVSHKKDLGPFERQVSCAQKGVGGKKNYDSLKNQIQYSKKVCAAVQEKCKEKKIPIARYMWTGTFNPVTGRGDDCRIHNAETQKWYDAICQKKKGYTCQRLVSDGKDKSKLVPCTEPIAFLNPLR
jgi:hypothetical protein